MVLLSCACCTLPWMLAACCLYACWRSSNCCKQLLLLVGTMAAAWHYYKYHNLGQYKRPATHAPVATCLGCLFALCNNLPDLQQIRTTRSLLHTAMTMIFMVCCMCRHPSFLRKADCLDGWLIVLHHRWYHTQSQSVGQLLASTAGCRLQRFAVALVIATCNVWEFCSRLACGLSVG